MYKPKIVLLIFVSGRLVLTGAKTKEDIDNGFRNIYPVLKECKKLPLLHNRPNWYNIFIKF